MSVIGTSIASTSSIVASTGQQTATGNADTARSISNSSVAIGQTASSARLASSDKSRAASFGEGRHVDSSFEKQSTEKNNLKNDKSNEGSKGALVNIEA